VAEVVGIALHRAMAPVVVTVVATPRADATPTTAAVTGVMSEMRIAGEMVNTGVATARRTPLATDACSASWLLTTWVVPLLLRLTRAWRSCPKKP
jgi:hypothetical protein